MAGLLVFYYIEALAQDFGDKKRITTIIRNVGGTQLRSNKNTIIFVLFIIIGAIVGTGIGEFLTTIPSIADMAAFLVKKYLILSVPPVTVNLIVATFVIGFSLQPSIMTMLGVIFGIFLYKRFY